MNCFFMHDFGKYGKLIAAYVGTKSQQARVCKNCGAIDVRTVHHAQINAELFNKSIEEIKE